jgi:hypothetical protein
LVIPAAPAAATITASRHWADRRDDNQQADDEQSQCASHVFFSGIKNGCWRVKRGPLQTFYGNYVTFENQTAGSSERPLKWRFYLPS